MSRDPLVASIAESLAAVRRRGDRVRRPTPEQWRDAEAVAAGLFADGYTVIETARLGSDA